MKPKKYWSSLPCPPPGYLLNPGPKPRSPAFRQILYRLSHQGIPKKVKVAQLYLTRCDPMDYTVNGTLQVRILEWVAVPSSGELPNPGIKPGYPAWQVDSLPTELPGKPYVSYMYQTVKPHTHIHTNLKFKQDSKSTTNSKSYLAS